MFTSAPTDLSIERLRQVRSLIEDVLEKLDQASYTPEDVKVNINWEVKQVNTTDELVPIVQISYTT